jgi:hypothetical protein
MTAEAFGLPGPMGPPAGTRGADGDPFRWLRVTSRRRTGAVAPPLTRTIGDPVRGFPLSRTLPGRENVATAKPRASSSFQDSDTKQILGTELKLKNTSLIYL